MNRLTALPALCALLAACSLAGSPAANTAAHTGSATSQQPQLKFQLASGEYRCEFGQKVEIQRQTGQTDSIRLDWQGNRHTLQRYDSTSGLPRYEDRQSGLVWIDLPWKSVLMDANSGRPLATDCKATKIGTRSPEIGRS